MFLDKKLTKLLKEAEQINIDDKSKVIFMSDSHRGNNSWTDDFAHNQNLFLYALEDYYKNGYTYIELGDGDELWKYKDYEDIKYEHKHIFRMLRKFYKEDRLYILYGNHNMVLKNKKFVKKHLTTYESTRGKPTELFPDIKIHEALNLNYKSKKKAIFLVHGHQGDLINDTFWRLGRFLVRYVWKSLQFLGVKDDTRAAKNFKKMDKIEKELIQWSVKNNQLIMAGHTHRPVFPDPGQHLYFNEGSGVHPRCITGIELDKGNLRLVKWLIAPDIKGRLTVNKEILEGPVKLSLYLNL